MMASVDSIREQQKTLKSNPENALPYEEFLKALEHMPDMALFGCVDARLPISNLGMERNKTLIHRIPGAFIGPRERSGQPEGATIAIALKKGVTDIVVMGHSDCSAMNCCLKGRGHPDNTDMEEVLDFLAPLEKERTHALHTHKGEQKQARALEEAAICESLDNLESHPKLKAAIDAGKVRIHGWLLDVHGALSKPPQPYIYEVTDRKNKTFTLMADNEQWVQRVPGPEDKRQAAGRFDRPV